MGRNGRVILVGAGLGDRLIAVAGLDAVRVADVVLHDRLVSPRLIAEARRNALVIDVGCGGHEADCIGYEAVPNGPAGETGLPEDGGDHLN